MTLSLLVYSSKRSSSSSTIIGLTTNDSVIIASSRGYKLNGVDVDSNFEWLYDIGSRVVVALEVCLFKELL